MMRIYVGQVGCRLNYSEMESLAGRLRSAGHTVVEEASDAQVIVFNTCAVTADAARGSRKGARALHAANPAARIVLTGCWATLEAGEATSMPGLASLIPNARKDEIASLLESWSADFDDPALLARLHPESTPLDLLPFDGPMESPRVPRTRAFVKVQDGCNNRCTFCIVTVARGESRSRSPAEIVEEVRAAVAVGVREVVLTGVHLGGYGRERTAASPTNLGALVRAILEETQVERLRLSSLEPWELAPGFFDLWQRFAGRLCPHLHLPLQAGADRQLRAMARRCTTASFRELVEDARTAIPDLLVTTDLIAGFPGESEEDFAAGLAFVEEMRFAGAHIFPYSARAGTAAASFAGQIAGDVKRERARRLREPVERTAIAERARFLGSVRPVLWEGAGQSLTDEPGLLWSGLTDNGMRVQAVAPAGVDLHGTITPVRLLKSESDVVWGAVEGIPECHASRVTGSNH